MKKKVMDSKEKGQTRILGEVQDVRCISVVISSHLTEMICNIKCNWIETCILIILRIFLDEIFQTKEQKEILWFFRLKLNLSSNIASKQRSNLHYPNPH